jgi:hypothetical protein
VKSRSTASVRGEKAGDCHDSAEAHSVFSLTQTRSTELACHRLALRSSRFRHSFPRRASPCSLLHNPPTPDLWHRPRNCGDIKVIPRPTCIDFARMGEMTRTNLISSAVRRPVSAWVALVTLSMVGLTLPAHAQMIPQRDISQPPETSSCPAEAVPEDGFDSLTCQQRACMNMRSIAFSGTR